MIPLEARSSWLGNGARVLSVWSVLKKRKSANITTKTKKEKICTGSFQKS